MADWMQHMLVIAIVVACLAALARQAVKMLRGKGGFGSCCGRGCGGMEPGESAGGGVQFLPVETLKRR